MKEDSKKDDVDKKPTLSLAESFFIFHKDCEIE
jgi:hypothetical protein